MTTIILTYATPGRYAEMASTLADDCERFGQPIEVVIREPTGDYWRNCLEKVFVVAEYRRRAPAPFLWVDADSRLLGPIDWTRFVDPVRDAMLWETERGTLGSGCHYWHHSRAVDILDHAEAVAREWVAKKRTGPDERVWRACRDKFPKRFGVIPHGLARIDGYYTQHPDAPIRFYRQNIDGVPDHER